MNVQSNTIARAAKWSTLTEILAKLAMPVSSMILARILAPSIFGIVASVNMVISFCELFADAGFQKYIVQHEVDEGGEIDRLTNVAFWANLVFSLVIWLLVCIYAAPIAVLVGCEGKSLAIIVACANLPLHAFSSIQAARLKRRMDFKTLFVVRMITLVVPFAVTIPVALFTRSYWALIVGTIASNVANVIAMVLLLKWKPRFYFDFARLKTMLSFSMWSMLESFLVWLINWGDIFIVGKVLSDDYLGIYKTSMNMTNQIIGVISAAIVPVMLSSLSRMQDDDKQFNETFYRISFWSGLLLIPMGVGMFLYQDTLCTIALGDGWSEGALLMGIWSLISAIAILFNSYNGSVLVAKGKPKISAIVQIIQLIAILPAVYFSVRQDFATLSYVRALVRIVGMLVHSIVVWKICRISCFKTIGKLLPAWVATAVMSVCAIGFISLHKGLWFNLLSIVICACVYGVVLLVFPSIRKNILPMLKPYLNKIKRKHS